MYNKSFKILINFQVTVRICVSVIIAEICDKFVIFCSLRSFDIVKAMNYIFRLQFAFLPTWNGCLEVMSFLSRIITKQQNIITYAQKTKKQNRTMTKSAVSAAILVLQVPNAHFMLFRVLWYSELILEYKALLEFTCSNTGANCTLLLPA